MTGRVSRSGAMSSTKIFRPWASSMPAGEKLDESKSCSENTNTAPFEFANCCSAFTRVPEPHGSMDEFLQDVSKFKFTPYVDDWTASNLLPAALSSSLQANENFVQSLSYLDSAYLNAAFPELYAASKNTKLKQRPKKFRCPHCKVSFSNNGQLKGHVRIHTGERPFKCDSEKCGKSFTRNEELTRHKRIHTGLRPFACDQCGKRFGRKDHLKKHIRTHFPQPRFVDANFIPFYPILFGY